jgi:tripartite-type tricarboxylate transporter receptor subunit TctC
MKPIFSLFLATLGFGVANHAQAQTWPAKPLLVVVPVAAGSLTDTISRLVSDRLSSQLGQTIVVENRSGAGGTIATAFVAKSQADGYTLLVHSNSHTIAPALYPTLSYHPARDFAAVTPLGISPLVLVVSPAKGFKTIGDLVAAAKANPGSLTFASVGVGTATHLSVERFRASAGIDAVHVPFRGGPQAVTEVIAGRVDFFFSPIGLALPQIRDGKLVPLVVNGSRRSAACRTFRPRRKQASPMQNSRSGLECSRRQKHRAPSSTSSTTRPSRRWRRPMSRIRSPGWPSIR